jgi:hypothetical protein
VREIYTFFLRLVPFQVNFYIRVPENSCWITKCNFNRSYMNYDRLVISQLTKQTIFKILGHNICSSCGNKFVKRYFRVQYYVISRSQWPRGLRHELSTAARTPGSWVQNSTPVMDVCIHLFCLCAVLCVGRGLATGWSPVQGVLPTLYRIT